jgi:hypothetical protein
MSHCRQRGPLTMPLLALMGQQPMNLMPFDHVRTFGHSHHCMVVFSLIRLIDINTLLDQRAYTRPGHSPRSTHENHHKTPTCKKMGTCCSNTFTRSLDRCCSFVSSVNNQPWKRLKSTVFCRFQYTPVARSTSSRNNTRTGMTTPLITKMS